MKPADLEPSTAEVHTEEAKRTALSSLANPIKWFRNANKDRADLVSSIMIAVLFLGWALFAWHSAQSTSPIHGPRAQPPGRSDLTRCTGEPKKRPVKVSPASGPGSTLNILVGTDGREEARHSVTLGIEGGRLCPGSILSTTASTFISGDDSQLRVRQVISWAKVDRYGTHLTIWVLVAPRFSRVSGFGGYSGTVFLNDPRAQGASVLVRVHALYPYRSAVLAWSSLAAFGGFAWAWFVHDIVKRKISTSQHQNLLRNLALRVAVALVTAVPIVKLQVLGDPNWSGTLSQYFTLATLVGAAAIAVTPTLRALILPLAPAKPSREATS